MMRIMGGAIGPVMVSVIVAYKLEERVYQSLQINVILPLTEPFTSNS